jgi:hypothetical protein
MQTYRNKIFSIIIDSSYTFIEAKEEYNPDRYDKIQI